jgi:hypothetical protein
MQIKFNIVNGILLVLALGLFLYLGRCSREGVINGLTLTIGNKDKAILKDSLVIDSVKRYTFVQNAIITSTMKSIKNLEAEKERLKKMHIKDVTAIGELNSTIDVLNKQLFTPTEPVIITIPGSIDSAKYLKLPQEYRFDDEWSYAIAKVAYPKSSVSFGLTKVPLHIIIGEQGQGLFKARKSVVVIDTPNPYLDIKKADIIVVQPKKGFLQRPAVWLGLGLVGGLLIP